jgi:hypothetical protein
MTCRSSKIGELHGMMLKASVNGKVYIVPLYHPLSSSQRQPERNAADFERLRLFI